MLIDHIGPELAQLAVQQDGVLTRHQLTVHNVSKGLTAAHVTARRWQVVARDVVLLHNAAPTRQQWMWIAVLDAGVAALASHTALELAGLRHACEESRMLHLLVPRGAKCSRLPGVVVHESRRFSAADQYGAHALPRVPPARAAVDAGAWQPWPRFACLMMAIVVQQRLVSVPRLRSALEQAGAVRHKAYMKSALSDIHSGAESLGEIDVAKACRRAGLQPPHRQSLRRDPAGRARYLDCEWTLADSSVVVLEVDGSHHMSAEHWAADMRRERKLVLTRRLVLRVTAMEVRLDPRDVIADLVAAGVPRRQPAELSDSEAVRTR